MLSLLTCLPASRVMIFSSLKCESNDITPLLIILQRFRIPWTKSAIFCVICKILQGLAPAHLFSLISCHSPRLHLLKSTYFAPTGHFSLDPKSCPCPSLYLAVLFYTPLEPTYLPFNLGAFPSTPLPTLKHLLSSHCIVITCTPLNSLAFNVFQDYINNALSSLSVGAQYGN